MKKIIFSLLLLLGVSASLAPVPTYAAGTGVVVTDIIADAILEEMIFLQNVMFSLMTDSSDEIIDLLDEIHGDLNGKYGHGNLTASELAQYQDPIKDKWEDVLDQSGSSAEFKKAQKSYAALYATDEDIQGVSELSKAQYQQSRNINRAALAASSLSYDKMNDHLNNIKDILAKMESSDDITMKETIDLNARLVAELSFLELQKLQQSDIQTQVIATDSQAEVNGTHEQSKFLSWDKK